MSDRQLCIIEAMKKIWCNDSQLDGGAQYYPSSMLALRRSLVAVMAMRDILRPPQEEHVDAE